MKAYFGLPGRNLFTVKNCAELIFILFLTVSLPAFSQNPVSIENALTGNPSSEWDIQGIGDEAIQGFATPFSINTGGTVEFKIDVKNPVTNYSVKIYRLGYYGGNGARQVADLGGTFVGEAQPAPLYDNTTGMTYCTNWSVSASWTATGAVSGVYIARLRRNDTGGASHIVFVVRDDARQTDILFKTADATWQAYNAYGGNNFYNKTLEVLNFGHAVKASYNRPFYTRGQVDWGYGPGNWLFNAEYPMIRWLERNGYNVSYITDVDMGRAPRSITPSMHKVLFSVGHDEYWSGTARANFETARANMVNLAFFSGNEIYWKTRWEEDQEYGLRLVCYKEGTMGENTCGEKCDPTPEWTGLWRAPSLPPATDGGRPENALTGQISWYPTVNSIQVPSEYKNHRFWRNTSIATMSDGQTVTFPYGTLGYEMDWEQYHDYYPAGRMTLSSTTVGGLVHKLSLYRHSNGALVFGAGTVQWAWGLDSNHDGGGDTENNDMQQATLNLLGDMAIQPATKQADLDAASISNDITAPASVITFPSNGANLPSSSSITITGTATDGGGGYVSVVEISTDGGVTWKPVTGTGTWTYNWVPVTSGAFSIRTRAFDDTGNMESGWTTGVNLVNVTVAVPVCPCSLFSTSTVPGNPSENDNNAVELGVKFQSTTDGYITGVRFYKGPQNTGTHTGNLWTAEGVNLASAIFYNETATGWQEVQFGSPVYIAANTIYVASYHTTSGYYAQDVNYFTNPLATYYLTALQDAAGSPNGVYAPSSSSTFPTQGNNASNYWVDVVFVLNAGPDNTPPSVVSVTPTAGASGVRATSAPTAVFSELLNPSSVTGTTVQMTAPGGVPVIGTVSLTGGRITFTPSSALDYSTTYSVMLAGGTGGISDMTNNVMTENYTWSFTTGAEPPPPPTEGPGGPILVISSAANPFSRYTVEILRAEGLNEFFAMDISEVTVQVMNQYKVIILGEFPLQDADFVNDLTAWVNAGGVLVAFRPAASLSGLLGISNPGGTLADAYLKVITTSGPGTGIVGETIQFHSAADLYTLNGATAIANLWSSATTETSYPAVTEMIVGTNGGKAYAFTYDLPRSIVYTRQGNPEWAGQKRDGQIDPIRSDDMFYPDWIDMNKVQIPQADEQQRLLVNIIIKGSMHKVILPRFWFLPKGLKAAVVMTGDDHGDSGMEPRFLRDIAMSPAGCNVQDWECVRSTGYFFIGSTFTVENALYYNSQGFEAALHINTNCDNYTPSMYESFVSSQLAAFRNTFPGVPEPETNRNHCIAFPDWSTTPEVEYANGIRLDVNYYYWPNSWHLNKPGMFTGSGNPMRFAKTDGTIIDVYQVVTQMQDEGQSGPVTPYPAFCDALLDKAIGQEGYYGVFCANMHFDTYDHPGANAITASAQARGIPVVSAKQMLDWLDGRNGSSFGNIAWSNNILTFGISVGTGARNLMGMLPFQTGSSELLSLTKDGGNMPFTREVIKGIEYAFFAASAGSYQAIYGIDEAAPVITGINAVASPDGTAVITWTTNELSDSRVDYGISVLELNLNKGSGDLVTSHSVTLSGLSPLTTYFFRVSSADEALNRSTEPIPPETENFTTPAGICAADVTSGDFSQGTLDGNTQVVLDGDGAVILRPMYAEEFSGTAVPSGWTAVQWPGGTEPVVGGGSVSLDGSHVTSNTTFGPGTILEFVATFTAGTFQNIGFSANAAFDSPWVVVGRGNLADNNLYARAIINGVVTDINMGSDLLGTPHNFKIKWNAASFEFYVDGLYAATINGTVSASMIIQISDYNPDGVVLFADWVRSTPYVSSGSFQSRVFDAGAERTWGAVNWNADLPEGTSLSISVRGGNDPDPGTWTGAFVSIATSGASANITNLRYIQYKADLSTTNTLFTPVLKDISISCDAPQGPPVVNLDPVSQSVCAGSIVSFSSGVIAFPPATVQWEVSANNGGTWAEINGASSSVLTFIAAEGDNGHQYQAVWTNSYGADISGAATLAVSPGPAGTLSASRTSIYEGEQYELIYTSTSGAGPFDLVINGLLYDNKLSGTPFVAGTAMIATESIWGNAVVDPQSPNDNVPIELGVKFRSSVAGKISGIRFYKRTENTNTHTGSLWSSTGTLIATGTFSNEPASGWMEMYFTTPVTIEPGVTYVASYHTTTGNYAYEGAYFGTDKNFGGSLTALSSGGSGGNGVYLYGAGGVFPTGTYNSTNYWVDVLFETGNTSVTTFNLESITGSDGCVTTGSPIDNAEITVNRARIWTGGGADANWNTPQNWSTGVVPTAAENAVIPTVTTPILYPTITGAVTTETLIVKPSASMTVEAGGELTVEGDLNTTGATFTINSTAVNNSGSLIVNGTPMGNVTYNRKMPTGTEGARYRYISLPVSSAVFPSGDFWRWNEEQGYWGEDQYEAHTAVSASGIGYTVAATDNTLSFIGTVLKEKLGIVATAPFNTPYVKDRDIWGGGGWNLLGNPFPSALSGVDADAASDNDFIHHNLASFDPSYQAMYIYDGTNYTYIALGIQGYPGGGTFTGTDVQSGQGFFVLAHHDQVPFSFTSAMRKHNTSAVMTKSASAGEAWPGLQLKAKYGDKESSTLIVYNQDMTAGLDPGYDIGLLSSGADVEIYTLLTSGGNDFSFTRQALPVDGASGIAVPVGIDSEKGGEVTFSAYTVPLGTQKFWLEDRKTGTYTDLTTKSYTVTLPAKTYGTGRFYIIASANTPTGINDPEDGSALRIWATGGRIIIRGTVSGRARCEVFDVSGRKVADKLLNDGDLNSVELASSSKGVLIVRVTDGARITTRKVTLL